MRRRASSRSACRSNATSRSYAIDHGIDAIPHDLIRSTSLLGYSILALDLEDAAAAEVLLPAIEPFVDEVSFNGVTSQGPVAAYVGKPLTLVGRYDEAEGRLLQALTMTESFGWEYHRVHPDRACAQPGCRNGASMPPPRSSWHRPRSSAPSAGSAPGLAGRRHCGRRR